MFTSETLHFVHSVYCNVTQAPNNYVYSTHRSWAGTAALYGVGGTQIESQDG
jgi:hypothetical protein